MGKFSSSSTANRLPFFMRGNAACKALLVGGIFILLLLSFSCLRASETKDLPKLVEKDFTIKKTPQSTLSSLLKEPKLSLRLSSIAEEIKEKGVYKPSLEEENFCLAINPNQFSIESSFYVPSFKFVGVFDKELLTCPLSINKGRLLLKRCMVNRSFEFLEISRGNQYKERENTPLFPSLEKIEVSFVSKLPSLHYSLDAESTSQHFQKEEIPFSLVGRSCYRGEKKSLPKKVCTPKEFTSLPSLRIRETENALAIRYFPNKEIVHTKPNSSLPMYHPPMIQDVEACFLFFSEIFSDEICLLLSRPSLPKNQQTFVASFFKIPTPYFWNEFLEETTFCSVSPQLETGALFFTFNCFEDLIQIKDYPKSQELFILSSRPETCDLLESEPNFHKVITNRPCLQFGLDASGMPLNSLGKSTPTLVYHPSLQKEKISIEKRALPEVAIPEFQNIFPLETKRVIALTLSLSRPSFDKQSEEIQISLDLNHLYLTQVVKKQLSFHQAEIDSSLLEEFPHLCQIITKAPSLDIIAYRDPQHEALKNFSSFSERYREALENISPSMFKETLAKTLAVDAFISPNLREQTIDLYKEKMTPRITLEELPCILVDLVGNDMHEALEGSYVPSHIHSALSISINEIEDPDTEMIHSESNEILEDYNQENSASSGLLALAHPEIHTSIHEKEIHALNESSRFTNAFLTEIPHPSYLETMTYDNEFNAEVHYSKQEDGKGYLFALKMRPKDGLHFPSPPKNFIFVIDGSSSIKKHRFGVFKEGVSRSLSYLKNGDSFNIVVADSKLTPFSETAATWNKRSCIEANEFLNKKQFRGYFVNYNPFYLIDKVTQYLDDEKENVIVLITDGHSFKDFIKHREAFQELAENNKGHFSIYTASASQNNNLTMLDLLSTFNKGELLHSKTHAAFSRQLAVMVKHIQHLTLKDVHVYVTDEKQETGIDLYPNQTALPSLYSDRPYTLYGTIDELKDFDLLLQGRSGDQWINIKQHITFKHGEKASSAIKRGLALQKAYVCYDDYLKSEDPSFLFEAEKILNPHSIPPATR